MLLIIFKILAWWTLASFIGGAVLCYFITVAKREPANQLFPLPSGSMDVNHPERVF